MKNSIKILVIIATASLLATLSNYFIAGWYNIIPWVIVALLIGWLEDTRRRSIIHGAVFGYVLFLGYIWLGYNGKTDTGSTIKFLLFDLGFSLLGGIAGLVGALVGNMLKGKDINHA